VWAGYVLVLLGEDARSIFWCNLQQFIALYDHKLLVVYSIAAATGILKLAIFPRLSSLLEIR